MIFVWIGCIVQFVKWLFVPPEVRIPKRNPNAPCPSCGWGKGAISATTNQGKPSIRHDCSVCKASWFEAPVLQAPDKIQAEPIKE